MATIGGNLTEAGVTRRVAKTMLLVAPQLAPRRPRAAHSVCGRPPAIGTFLSSSSAPNPSQFPSGEKNGLTAFSVPGIACDVQFAHGARVQLLGRTATAHVGQSSAVWRNSHVGGRAAAARVTMGGCSSVWKRATKRTGAATGQNRRASRRSPRARESGRHEGGTECQCPRACRRPTLRVPVECLR